MTGVDAVVFRVRGLLRRRWRSALVVAAIVAVVTGAALTLAAGAQRTAAAPDAYTAAVGGHVDSTVQQRSGRPRTEEVATLPGVEAAEGMTFLFAAVDPERETETFTISFAGSRLFTSRLLSGRATDPTDPYEFVADETFVAEHNAHVGDRFPVVTWSRDQTVNGEAYVDDPEGPSFEAELVGVLDTPDVLQSGDSTAVFSPALLGEDIGIVATIISVRLEPGVTTDELRSELDGLPDSSEFSAEPAQIVDGDVRNAVDAQAKGIWLMAAVVAIAALAALGQLLTRHARLSASERRPLSALGFTSDQLTGETIARAAVPAAVGVAAGTVLATLASGLFPAGFVRRLEPDPGLRADYAVHAVGGVLLLLGLLAWVGMAVRGVRPDSARQTLSVTSETLARRAPSAAAATGTRFALTGVDGSSRSAAGTLVALALIVAGFVRATAFAASLDRLVSERSRFGGNYTFAVGDLSDMSASDLRTSLEGDPDIAGLMILSEGQARAGGTTIGLVGVERVQGDLAPRLLDGRLPTGPLEIATGRVTARQLHVGLGDELDLLGSGGRGVYRLVGLAVVPTIGGNDGVGLGGVVTSEGLLRLEPVPSSSMAAVVLRSGAPSDAAERIAALVGAEPGVQGAPAAIINVARVRRIPGILAALLGGLALLTMIHAIIVSIQGRRRDLAVLRALGGDRRWISRAVHWQATMLTALPLVVGVPIGLIAGSVVFRAFADRIGAVPDPALPFVLILVTTMGLIGVANLAALVPARQARRLSTAQQLQVE